MITFVELGNTTLKIATLRDDGGFDVDRYAREPEFLEQCAARDSGFPVAMVGRSREGIAAELVSRFDARLITRSDFSAFVGGSYDTPETLGTDRVLNLLGMLSDGVVVSCGTAITIDAIRDGEPYWGAILPGFATASQSLHLRVPSLPEVDMDDAGKFPSRTTQASVAAGILAGTAYAVAGLADELANNVFGGLSPDVILTGGDAQLMLRIWRRPATLPTLDEALLFRGMMAL